MLVVNKDVYIIRIKVSDFDSVSFWLSEAKVENKKKVKV